MAGLLFKKSHTGRMPPGVRLWNKIEAQVLFSDELVENWPYLDDFEGDGYKRILAKYELENGEIGGGYIYAINDGDE